MNRKSEEKSPAGVDKTDRRYALSPTSSLHINGIGDFANSTKRHYQSTFEVKKKHEHLANGKGVRFNVETVSSPELNHLRKPTISREDFLKQVQSESAAVYRKEGGGSSRGHQEEASKSIRLEAVSNYPENLVFVGTQGFFAACLSAFAQHLPLAISPDHIWALISYAFAQHVDKHAEELRANFVEHDGKKRLLVMADHMVMSGGGGPDSGTRPEVWESTIFSSFSRQIKTYIGEKTHSAIAGDFSTTTPTSRAGHEITLMSAMKHYFSYGMSTLCGIPNVTLLGSEADWLAVRSRAEALGELMTPEFSATWMPVLLPVLNEFVASYQGRVNHGFWQSMVKLRYRGGSGARSAVSGWLQLLYPYLKGGRLNQDLRPWQEMYFRGPDPDNIPPITSSAPVDWDYHGTTYDLHFCAGFVGCTQDQVDGTVTPTMGWYVTHDPPEKPDERLAKIEKEIADLLKGHAEEAQAEVVDTNQPWFVRVSMLFLERKAIYGSFAKNLQVEGTRLDTELTYGWYSDDRKRDLKAKVKAFEAEKRKVESAPSYGSVQDMIKVLFLQKKV
jgi:hypothetical protein